MQRQKRMNRLQVMLTSDELSVLDDWRFQHRMPSRAEAVRCLLRKGLAGGRAQADSSAMYGRMPSVGGAKKSPHR